MFILTHVYKHFFIFHCITGDYLRDKYDGATEVKVSKRGKLQIKDPRYSLPTAQDLVYLEESPNYCVKNLTVVGIFRTMYICYYLNT